MNVKTSEYLDPSVEYQHQSHNTAYIWCCCRLELRSQLLETLRPFTFPGVTSLSQDILADVAHRFPVDPEAWDLRAHAAWEPVGQPPADPLPESSAQQLVQVNSFLASQYVSHTIQPDGHALRASSCCTSLHGRVSQDAGWSGIHVKQQISTSGCTSSSLAQVMRSCALLSPLSSPDFSQRQILESCMKAQTMSCTGGCALQALMPEASWLSTLCYEKLTENTKLSLGSFIGLLLPYPLAPFFVAST